MNSRSHWRSTVISPISSRLSSRPRASFNWEASSPTSFSPPGHRLMLQGPALAQGVGAQVLNPLGHFLDHGHPFGSVRGRDFKHLQAAPAQADLLQQLLGVLAAVSGSEISFPA